MNPAIIHFIQNLLGLKMQYKELLSVKDNNIQKQSEPNLLTETSVFLGISAANIIF